MPKHDACRQTQHDAPVSLEEEQAGASPPPALCANARPFSGWRGTRQAQTVPRMTTRRRSWGGCRRVSRPAPVSRKTGPRATRIAQVEGVLRWSARSRTMAAHAFGLAVPSGIISTTDVGGLTLGGGMGHLSRTYGMTVDNLLAADVVLADGSLVTAGEDEHPELFWALRGGGGNFGVVVSFLFRLHPVGTIAGGPTFWPMEQAEEVMRWYRDFITEAPEDLNGFFAFLTVPPVAPFPEELHLQKACGAVWCYTSPADQADTVFAPGQPVETGKAVVRKVP